MKRVLLFLALLLLAAFAQAFTFVQISDTHITGAGSHEDNLSAIIGEINAMNPPPAFVVYTGDMTETGRPPDIEKYQEITKALKMPVYSVLGNHETKWTNLGKETMRVFFDRDPYYSFDYEGMHFVAMDSSMWQQHHGLLDRSQLTWLKQDLDKAGRQTPSALFYHHCPGFIPNEAELLQTIEPYNVRLILVGHGHNFKTWRRNGLLFQECKGGMNNQGGYRILDVSDGEIRSYTKLVGKDKALDAVIPLTNARNPVTLYSPQTGKWIEGKVQIRASVMPGEGRKLEYAIDGDWKPLPAMTSAVYGVAADLEGTPGWHLISVRATHPDGMEWQENAWVRINGKTREAWRVNTSGGVQRAVAVFGDRVYFGTLGGDVYCLETATGKEVWRHSLDSDVISGVAVDGSRVYLGTADGRIIGLDALTGEERWGFQTGGPIQGAPLVGDGRIFVGSGESAFYALDAKTGDLAWKYPMDRFTQVQPLLLDGVIYFGAWDKYFYALNASDGSLKWKTLIGINFFYSTASSDPVTDGKSIAANVTRYKPEDPDIYCLDANNGDVIWKIRQPENSDCGFNSPCLIGDKVYSLAGNGIVLCMRMKDGSEIWRKSIGFSLLGGRAVTVDGKLYIPGLRGNVACMDAKSGEKLWTYSLGSGYLFGSAAVWEDLVIVPSCEGNVTALRR